MFSGHDREQRQAAAVIAIVLCLQLATVSSAHCEVAAPPPPVVVPPLRVPAPPAPAAGGIPLVSIPNNGIATPNTAGGSDATLHDLGDPEAISSVVNSYILQDSGLAFFKDINFKLKVFHENSSDNATSLGFSYDYQKSLNNVTLPVTRSDMARGLDLSFKASGNVAFDSAINPENFLDTNVNVAFYQSSGGAIERTPAEAAHLGALLAAAAGVTPKDWPKSPEREAYVKEFRNGLTDQFYFHVAGNFALESNQTFSKKQYVYGGNLGLDAKGWKDDGTYARLNLIDYPFALLRILTGYEKDGSIHTLGTSIPTAIIGAAYVDPLDDDPRTALVGKSGFPRFKAEVSFKTPVARLMDAPVYFSANYRDYQEIDAKAVVRHNNLDQFQYFVATLSSATGVFVSYSTGKLPFDAKNDQIYQIGWQFHL
jgi:hypothetical protein